MDYHVQILFKNNKSKTVIIKDLSHGTDAIRKSFDKLNGLESRDVIGANIIYIGEHLDFKRMVFFEEQ